MKLTENEYSLLTEGGERKYLNRQERLAFYICANKLSLERKLFCLLIYYTGARISEIYELTPWQIDISDKSIIVRSLKRRKTVYRQIPVPDNLIQLATLLLEQNNLVSTKDNQYSSIWPFTLRTGARTVKRIMENASISGIKACSRGLRHGFAVHAINKVNITTLQTWLGHANISTTAIYLNVSGEEAREMAMLLWDEEDID